MPFQNCDNKTITVSFQHFVSKGSNCTLTTHIQKMLSKIESQVDIHFLDTSTPLFNMWEIFPQMELL